MFKKIANILWRNLNKGVLINRPDGPNVYENVPKDYTGNVSTKKLYFWKKSINSSISKYDL